MVRNILVVVGFEDEYANLREFIDGKGVVFRLGVGAGNRGVIFKLRTSRAVWRESKVG